MQKQAIFLKAIGLMQTDVWQTRIKQVLKDETACTEFWAAANVRAGIAQLMEASSVGSAIRGQTFPSAVAPGGHTIVQRKPHGVM